MTDDLIELRGLKAHLKVILSLDSWNGVFLVLKIEKYKNKTLKIFLKYSILVKNDNT
jgi:hypothetical protein